MHFSIYYTAAGICEMNLLYGRTFFTHNAGFLPLLSTRPMLVNSHLKAAYCTDKSNKGDPPWRVPWHQREGEWYSAFSLFAPKKGNSPDLIRFLQSPIDFRPVKIRSWWRRKKEEHEIFDQRYIAQRHDTLGSDLAAAHFVVHRGGSVKFVGQSDWVKMDDDEEYDLPSKYRPDLVIDRLDLSEMKIRYEGFQNLTNLKQLQWLSVNGCEHIDDWCVDRISGEYQGTLEYLDLSNCHQVTHRSLAAMYRFTKLKTLKLNNLVNSKSFELACLLLEDINPNLSIEGVMYMNVSLEEEKVSKG